jgi:hypothetical protein
MGREAIEREVKKHFLDQMDKETDALRSMAIWDLLYGPFSAQYFTETGHEVEYPGYSKALERLEEWADLHVVEVWVDEDGFVVDTEPQAEEVDGELVEPYGYTHFDRKSVKRAVFERLVSDGGMSI